MTIKVAHLIDSGGFYGAEVMLLNLCREQISQGLEVEVISIGLPDEPPKDLEMKLRDNCVNVTAWRMKPLPDPRESLKIIRYCKKNNVDIIHSHGYKGNILLGMLPKFLRKLPVVCTVHGYTKEKKMGKLYINHAVDRVCLKRLDAIVMVSESMYDQISLSSKIGNKIHVINNGIPDTHGPAGNESYKSKFRQGEIKIGSLGRLSYEKNFQLLITAMKSVISYLPQVRLVIYGEGPLRNELEQLIDKEGLGAYIELPGYLHNTQSFISELDIFVNSSLTEGMPISLLEAMREGCRIVATDISANRELLKSLECRTYLSQINQEALAQCIIEALRTQATEIERERSSYIKTFKKYFSSSLMAKRYTELYINLKNRSNANYRKANP